MTLSDDSVRTDMGEVKPLRLWPGITIVSIQVFTRFVLPLIAPEAMEIGMMAGFACILLLVIWWLFFSRATKMDRLVGLGLMIVIPAILVRFTHISVETGMMGMMFYIYALPTLCVGFVVWAVFFGKLPTAPRRITMAAAIFLSTVAWTLVKTSGFSGDGNSEFSWRWAPTPEDLLLAHSNDAPSTPLPDSISLEEEATWPGFRGPNRDSHVHNAVIETNWESTPPQELWRREIGPAWSSFAVNGNLIFTQEQRGEEEVVSCYRLDTGEPVWMHSDKARFWESNAGAGPRGTPTLSGDRVYTLGGTGIVNALDARTGSLIWTQNAGDDTGAKLPTWAFSGSPLVVNDLVLITASGSLIAYDAATGQERWKGPAGGEGYCSPHLANLNGVTQVLQLSGDSLTSVSPQDGALLWEHAWDGFPIVQPAITADQGVLISVNANSGMRRLEISQDGGTWDASEVWTSKRLKPYFNDFVIHKNHVYGFDGSIMACMDLQGERVWKGGRYGNGQLLLLADQDLMLILAEQGDLALVKATPDQFTELARVPALEGRTWNHPVLANHTLLVRNDREMAAYRLK